MPRRLPITRLPLVTASLALGHMENERAGHQSTGERQEEQAARQRHEGSPQSAMLLLQAEEGERMVQRWGWPRPITVDPRHGGSPPWVVGTGDLPPRRESLVHKPLHTDEVVLLLQGTGVATLGRCAAKTWGLWGAALPSVWNAPALRYQPATVPSP
jgi:hypothetical protein